ncbi:hypothetical protein B0H10DRAFT_545276 [Mycena sp. CBHHK59/15]|nr:hypothetical protein B0H10DRAFT_545276 [Mycena sp. CBHHK59/15]
MRASTANLCAWSGEHGAEMWLRKVSQWLCKAIREIHRLLSTSSSWLPQSRKTTDTNTILPRVLHARHALHRSLCRLPIIVVGLGPRRAPGSPSLSFRIRSPAARPSLRQRIVSKALAFFARGRRTQAHESLRLPASTFSWSCLPLSSDCAMPSESLASPPRCMLHWRKARGCGHAVCRSIKCIPPSARRRSALARYQRVVLRHPLSTRALSTSKSPFKSIDDGVHQLASSTHRHDILAARLNTRVSPTPLKAALPAPAIDTDGARVMAPSGLPCASSRATPCLGPLRRPRSPRPHCSPRRRPRGHRAPAAARRR